MGGKIQRIEVVREEDADNSFHVAVDGFFAEHLTIDEALGVVASALFAGRPLYVRSPEEWAAIQARWAVKPDRDSLIEVEVVDRPE